MRINTDWSASPPVEMWRRPIGPGWSSFAVRGDLLYTQEQRGEDEIVACYKLSTGEPVWRHRDAVRFWESNGGAGPRGDADAQPRSRLRVRRDRNPERARRATGAVVWSRNAASDTGRKVPIWGFASSPLVVDDVVVVAASGTLVAYDVATGKPRWLGPATAAATARRICATIDGVAQILLLSGPAPISVAPADGTCSGSTRGSRARIVQPAMTVDGDVLITHRRWHGRDRHAAPRGRARSGRMDRRGALDVERR